MNHDKKNHIERIRSETAYPAFRMMTQFGCWIFWFIGGWGLLAAFVDSFFGGYLSSQVGGALMLVAGLIWGLFMYFLGLVFKEASLMLADAADSVTDANSRHEE